jgi:NAD(P)-dependent dehydrogenase (short-subunit alcohol dehydrogenase family)
MSKNTVWFITGAARGMGTDIAKAALAAGYSVVATARDAEKVTEAVGDHENLLALPLDITDPAAAESAVDAALARFGSVDVLVNNAGNFYAGYFEVISPEQFRKQMETNFFGPLNVTRAVLPVMRARRSGHVITISSTAGLTGVDFCSAYSSSKFALEGWMETLRLDVEPYGIKTTLVEPGFFRTELLVEGASTIWPELSIEDYEQRTKDTITGWKTMNGKQGGDPAKLAAALISISEMDEPPVRFLAGADAVQTAEQKAAKLIRQANAHRELSSSLQHDDA